MSGVAGYDPNKKWPATDVAILQQRIKQLEAAQGQRHELNHRFICAVRQIILDYPPELTDEAHPYDFERGRNKALALIRRRLEGILESVEAQTDCCDSECCR